MSTITRIEHEIVLQGRRDNQCWFAPGMAVASGRSPGDPPVVMAMVQQLVANDIEPGSPWENGYVESFHGKFRDELLNVELFDTLWEAKVLIEQWREEYNRFRPHSSLGYRPPAPEAIAWPPDSEPLGALHPAASLAKLAV